MRIKSQRDLLYHTVETDGAGFSTGDLEAIIQGSTTIPVFQEAVRARRHTFHYI